MDNAFDLRNDNDHTIRREIDCLHLKEMTEDSPNVLYHKIDARMHHDGRGHFYNAQRC